MDTFSKPFKVGDRVATTHMCAPFVGTIDAIEWDERKGLLEFLLRTDTGQVTRTCALYMDRVEA